MGKVRAKLAGACVVAALMVGGFAASPVGATTQAIGPTHFPGVYTVHVVWQLDGKFTYTLQLKKNHTGSDAYGDSITWSASGTAIQITLVVPDGPTAIYTGSESNQGIMAKPNPGYVTNNTGDSGYWWAVKRKPA